MGMSVVRNVFPATTDPKRVTAAVLRTAGDIPNEETAMAPPRLDQDGGYGSAVTVPGSATTEVNPGDIEDFAQYLKTLQQYWADPQGPAASWSRWSAPQKLDLGVFPSAIQVAAKYEATKAPFTTAFGQLNQLLLDLEQASRAIAKNYRTAEALADATVADVDKALADAQSDNGASAPAAGSTPPPT